MTVRTRLDQRGQLVKVVTVTEGVVTVEVPAPLPLYKPVNVVPPDSVPAGSSSSPRELDAYRLEWAEGYKGLGLLQAGSRVGIPGIGILELLGPPEGPQDGGYGAPAQLASILYPLTAELQEQGGDTVEESVQLAMWDETESQERAGRYETFDAEAPIDFRSELTTKRQLMVSGRIFKITSTASDLAGPRVLMTLRTQTLG
jgi:hypothetical protein